MSAPGRVDVVFSLARAENGAIGYHGKLPWRLPNDMKRFKQLSMGKPLVMGRASFARDLEYKPLPGRLNIVVTRDPTFTAQGVTIAHSIVEALRIGKADAIAHGVDEIHVIGGAEIFRASLPYARRIYLAEVHARPEADTFLEPFDPTDWRETFRERHEADARHTYAYTFLTLERIAEPLPIG
jgi:dihydrofolate reductase